MQITLKLYASLGEYLPDGASEHVVEVDVEGEATPHGVLDLFNVPRAMTHLVLLNGIYLEPVQRDRPQFKEGDVLAVWPPVAGGDR